MKGSAQPQRRAGTLQSSLFILHVEKPLKYSAYSLFPLTKAPVPGNRVLVTFLGIF